MGWEDVEHAARRQARNLTWSTPGTEVVGKVERTFRRMLGRSSDRTIHHRVASRLVMVVPTAGGRNATGADQTYGWAVRLTEHGHLEYLRWQAFGRPDWDAPFPFQEHELHPLTPGADHWAHLDNGQFLKTDLDWSPANVVPVNSAESTESWQIVPQVPQTDQPRAGDGLLRALARMPHTEHPVLDALTHPHAITS